MPENSNGPKTTLPPLGPARLVRTAIGGILMGTANLIPGVSGGTMILAMGLYREFIDSVADVTAFRFSLRRVIFLGVMGAFAVAAIVLLAKLILYLLFHHAVAMFALFIGLTLGGAPTLARALKPARPDVIVATLAGLLLMIGVLLLKRAQGGGFPHHPVMDVVAGIVGATTMVLPGVSGSYMLLVLEQYDRIIGAIDDRDLSVIVPVGIGVVIGIIGLSNLLKLLLRRFARPTTGVLLGILLGSVIGLWPFGKAPGSEALERRSVAELRAFADTWQIPGIASASNDPGGDATSRPTEASEKAELMERILANWDQMQRSPYSTTNMVTAIVCALVGFATTFALGRGQAALG